jgi:dephospho-CoA kinase
MKIIGLTGSIAMGKSDTLRMFAEEGIPTFDADQVVHSLYANGGRGVAAVERLCPDAVIGGAVDRRRLTEAIEAKPSLLADIERAVHPLVRQERDQFIAVERAKGTELVVIDIPLLFETHQEKEFDSIVVVSAPSHVQKSRAMMRPGMTEERLNRILSRQMPDAEKRARAHFIVDTAQGHESARSQVRRIVSQLLS